MVSCFGDCIPWSPGGVATSGANAVVRVYCRRRTVTGMPLVVGHAVVYIRRHLSGDTTPLLRRVDSQGVHT